MTRKVLLLLACTMLAWVILAIPAWCIWEGDTLVFSGVAAALSAIPAVLTMGLIGLVGKGSPDHWLFAMLGGSVGRMLIVLLGGLVLYMDVPPFKKENSFLYWLMAFYLITLVLEKTLLLKDRLGTKNEGTAPSAT